MIASDPGWARDSERVALEGLRPRYEAEGFIFTIEPDPASLPAFFGHYTPDAVARRPGRNVAIEVKRRNRGGQEEDLRHIRRLFDGRPEWELDVLFVGSDSQTPEAISRPRPGEIRERLAETQAMTSEGHLGAALVIAWSLLEATSRLGDAQKSSPRAPGTVIQTLAMNGAISAETEQRLRKLIALRNRIVHGDMLVEPAREDVDTLLAAVEEALEGEPV